MVQKRGLANSLFAKQYKFTITTLNKIQIGKQTELCNSLYRIINQSTALRETRKPPKNPHPLTRYIHFLRTIYAKDNKWATALVTTHDDEKPVG